MKYFILLTILINLELFCAEIPNCEKESYNRCDYCKENYYLTMDSLSCVAACAEGNEEAYEGKCYTKLDNCASYYYDYYYNYSFDLCLFCENDYKLDENGKCTQCPKGQFGSYNYCFDNEIPNCSAYSYYKEGEKCLFCDDGYEPNEDSTKCVKCRDGYYSFLGDKCSQIENCLFEDYINNKNYCYLCIDGYSNYNDYCIKDCEEEDKIAPFGSCNITKINYCSLYKENGKCEKCDYFYKLSDDETKCEKCESGKIGYGKTCIKEFENCYEQNGTKCEYCNDGYTLNSNKCEPCQNGTIEIDGKCFDIIPNCDTYDDYNYECLYCKDNYYLSPNKKSCSECPQGQTSLGLSCFNRIENCEIYGDFSNFYGCHYCKNDSTYYLTSNRQQCNKCNENEYEYNSNCIPEIKYCLNYSGEKECSQCLPEFQLVNNTCVLCPSLISDGRNCVLGTYQCIFYDNSGNCLECNDGYKLSASKESCIKIGTEEPTKQPSLIIIILFIFGIISILLFLLKLKK